MHQDWSPARLSASIFQVEINPLKATTKPKRKGMSLTAQRLQPKSLARMVPQEKTKSTWPQSKETKPTLRTMGSSGQVDLDAWPYLPTLYFDVRPKCASNDQLELVPQQVQLTRQPTWHPHQQADHLFFLTGEDSPVLRDSSNQAAACAADNRASTGEAVPLNSLNSCPAFSFEEGISSHSPDS